MVSLQLLLLYNNFFFEKRSVLLIFLSAYGLNPKGVTPHPNEFFSAVFSLHTVCLLSFHKKIGSFVKLTLVARGERVRINSEIIEFHIFYSR